MKISNNIKYIVISYCLPFIILAVNLIYKFTSDTKIIILNNYFFVGVIVVSFMICLALTLFNYQQNYSLQERPVYNFFMMTILFSPFGDFIIIPMIGLIISLFFNKEFRKKITTKFDCLDYIWLAFVIFCITHSFFIPQIDKYSAVGISFAFLGYGILFKIARHITLPKQIKTDASVLFCAVITITVLFAFSQYFYPAHINIIDSFTIYTDIKPRLTSVFSTWAANAAGFLVMSLSVLFYLMFFSSYNKKIKTYIFIAITLNIVAILATETRMSLLFIIGFLGMSVIFYPFTIFKKIRFVLPLLPLLFIPFLVQYSEKWQETLSTPLKQDTIADRIHQYQYGISLWQDNPLTGVGLMNFRYYYDQYGDPLIKKLQPGHGRIEFLHNIYLSFLTETGIIGLLIFLSTIGILFYRFYSNIPKFPAYFGLYFLTGLLCVGFVDSWLFVLKFSIMIFPILGFTVGQITQD